VVVFEDGQIIEQGSHEHLLARQGLYARLYRDQLSTTRPALGHSAARRAPD
jgi:ABC-type multidrug transport system fused ATPase/permease subunit